MNHPGLPQTIVIIGYMALLLLLGAFAGRLFRGTKEDYQLASHSIGPFLLLMSLFGTTMTAFALVGSSGEAFEAGIGVYGMMASSSGIVHSMCFFIIGVKVWSLARQHGYGTQIAFFRDRLESPAIGLVLFPILVGLVIPYVLVGIIGGGSVVTAMTAGLWPDGPLGFSEPGPHQGGVPRWLGSLVICGVVLTYVFIGGMRGTAWANAFQTMVFMVLGVVTFAVIARQLGGQDDLFANLRRLGEALPEEKATREGMSKTHFLSYMLIPLSVAMFPHVFQHWLTARSAATFKLPVVCQPLFIMIVWVPCILVGVWATTPLLGEALERVWDQRNLAGAPPEAPESPNLVLPFLVKTLTHPLLGGFLAAGILAAIMSSLDSQFLCLGTIFNNDIVSYYVGKERVGDSMQVWLTRGFIVAIVAISYLLSLPNPRSVFALGIWCFSGFTALFPIVFAALYWRRLTTAGAWAGILAAAASWGGLFWQGLRGSVPLREYIIELPLFGETYEVMPVVVMTLCSLVAMVVVSLVTPRPSDATLAKFFPERDAPA